MKILHTSDWHLGHTLYNYDRTEEQMAMLLQMVNIVREEKPDVFLLCGDVYHTPQPSAAVQTMFTNALVEITVLLPLINQQQNHTALLFRLRIFVKSEIPQLIFQALSV